ncbi:hypothetical protein V9T40_002386 [Parthenolecanium corni]|uniref:CRAL-TRIO domain-containing protein n=1 Tax=Parthenolecanium corni TaxID=536013 RepID=A0AAN9TG58_9HEMI
MLCPVIPQCYDDVIIRSYHNAGDDIIIPRHVFKLPQLSIDNSGLFFGGLTCFEPEKLDVADAVGLFFSLVDIHSNLEPYAPGWRIILDAKGFTFGHLVKLTASLGAIKKTICYLQDAMQIRLKGIHVINTSPVIVQFVGIIKPFMKKHLYEMIHLYTPAEIDNFHEIVHPDSLPEETGGKSGTINELVQNGLDELEKYQNWFEDDELLARIDVDKRRTSIAGGALVVEGFRKLTFD